MNLFFDIDYRGQEKVMEKVSSQDKEQEVRMIASILQCLWSRAGPRDKVVKYSLQSVDSEALDVLLYHMTSLLIHISKNYKLRNLPIKIRQLVIYNLNILHDYDDSLVPSDVPFLSEKNLIRAKKFLSDYRRMSKEKARRVFSNVMSEEIES